MISKYGITRKFYVASCLYIVWFFGIVAIIAVVCDHVPAMHDSRKCIRIVIYGLLAIEVCSLSHHIAPFVRYPPGSDELLVMVFSRIRYKYILVKKNVNKKKPLSGIT